MVVLLLHACCMRPRQPALHHSGPDAAPLCLPLYLNSAGGAGAGAAKQQPHWAAVALGSLAAGAVVQAVVRRASKRGDRR